MNILLINQSYSSFGGANAVCLNTGRILSTRGHKVSFFCEQPANKAEGYTESVYFYPTRSNRIEQIANDFYNIKASCSIESVIENVHPDIVHIHQLDNISYSIIKYLKRKHIPIVITLHDYHLACPVSHFLDKNGMSCEKCLDRKYFRCICDRCSRGRFLQSLYATLLFKFRRHFWFPTKVFDGVVFVSNFSKEKNILHLPELKALPAAVIYNSATSVDYSDYRVKDYYLYFGRLSYEKGVDLLVKAFGELSNLKLVIAGDGPLGQELKPLMDQCPNIKYVGYKNGEELQKLVAEAKFVVVPSVCYENNPMAVVESYTLSVPVLGSQSGAIPEVVIDKQTGFLFEKSNVSSLVSTVIKTTGLTDEEYQKLRKGAFNFYEENFTEKTYYNKLMTFYESVIYKNNNN